MQKIARRFAARICIYVKIWHTMSKQKMVRKLSSRFHRRFGQKDKLMDQALRVWLWSSYSQDWFCSTRECCKACEYELQTPTLSAPTRGWISGFLEGGVPSFLTPCTLCWIKAEISMSSKQFPRRQTQCLWPVEFCNRVESLRIPWGPRLRSVSWLDWKRSCFQYFYWY